MHIVLIVIPPRGGRSPSAVPGSLQWFQSGVTGSNESGIITDYSMTSGSVILTSIADPQAVVTQAGTWGIPYPIQPFLLVLLQTLAWNASLRVARFTAVSQ